MSKQTTIFCTNCGETGHSTKQCLHPITSFGVILFRVKGEWNQAANLLNSEASINGLEGLHQSNLEYLLIRRRDSLGFIDIMRAKYKLNDIPYISQQIRGMTREEQQKLINEPFDTLWEQLWGIPLYGSNPYRHEKEQSRVKLDELRNGTPSLREIVESVNSYWDTPEWGFPKGRRDPHETEYTCALREMWEETGLSENDIVPIRNLEPIREIFFGSNNIQYCHKYYIMYMPEYKEIVYDPTNELMQREIGDLRWCSLDEGVALIRSDNIEKREVLFRISRLLRNYCPFQNGKH
jgi:8-oxo-dGTP pyrophosphatase MutT (NUDIX family)